MAIDIVGRLQNLIWNKGLKEERFYSDIAMRYLLPAIQTIITDILKDYCFFLVAMSAKQNPNR